MTTIARILKVLSEQTGVHESNITPQHSLITDLGCDSLAIVELTQALEEAFGIKLNDETFSHHLTVQDVIDHVASVCNANPESDIARAARLDYEASIRARTDQWAARDSAFCHAKTIAEAARALDDLIPDPGKAKHITALHSCATLLAGSRAHEIYAGDEEARMLPIALAARMTGCSEVEEVPA